MENFILTFGIPEEACDALVEYHKENKYDKTAISIINNGKLIGYVPMEPEYYKNLCNENITEPLKIINIKIIKGNYGIRVIPKCFFK